ncbi:MAG: serine hydrolase domain-containing protein [Bacteroidia bacterium]
MKYLLSAIIILSCPSIFAQSDYSSWEGNWKGQIENPAALALEVTAEMLSPQKYRLQLRHEAGILYHSEADVTKEGLLTAQFGPLIFKAQCDESGHLLFAFMRGLGMYEYSLPLTQDADKWTARWWPWHTPVLSPANVYLAIEIDDSGIPQVYPFFDDGRFPGTFAAGFSPDEDGAIDFFDFLTGMQMRATLAENALSLQWMIGEKELTQAEMSPFEGDFPVGFKYDAYANDPFQPAGFGQAFPAGTKPKLDRAPLLKMVEDIEAETLTFTDAVLIAQGGELIYENYFNGFGPHTPHQLRSAQKSMGSALAGVAIADGYISSVKAKLIDHLPEAYQSLMEGDSQKEEICLSDLLTMSSGLDAVDFGIDRTSLASEDQYQPTPDWTKTILSAPMINTPGKEANYGSANPCLVGEMLREATGKDLGMYQHEKIFQPLGIEGYVIQNTPEKFMYLGGGMLMRPQDMLKFGQLYLNQGVWQGQQILPKSWIEASTQNYLPLANTNDKNGYGYYWWHHTYEVKGKTIHSVEARGAGGQYIFVIEELDLVVAITSGNFRNGRFFQPEIIMRDYILPAIL